MGHIGVPLLNSARSHLGLVVSGLQGLPPELLLRILHLSLHIADQGVLCQSLPSRRCPRSNFVARNVPEELWESKNHFQGALFRRRWRFWKLEGDVQGGGAGQEGE